MPLDFNNPSKTDRRFYRNVIIKAALMFIAITFLFAFTNLHPFLGRISAYNFIFPGRLRLPYGDDPSKDYNLSINNLEAMFASHIIDSGTKPDKEYRVILIGDSSTWGFLQKPSETITSFLNNQHLSTPDGRVIRAYNLGYPVMSLTKDLLILSYAKNYQPDLIVWLFTLESFPINKQLLAPLLQNNPGKTIRLIEDNSLDINTNELELNKETFWRKTLIGQRRNLADLLWLQLYGFMWAASGIDQDIPDSYTSRIEDLSPDQSFHDLKPPHLFVSDMAIEVLQAGRSLAGDIPILFVNEPIFISRGENSDIRYNFYYPRWAYDDYRRIIQSAAQLNNWWYLDYWNVIPYQEFTNTAIHLTPNGSLQLSDLIGEVIIKYLNQHP